MNRNASGAACQQSDEPLHSSVAIAQYRSQSAVLTQGWWGLATGYAAVAAPMFAGLLRGRAPLRKLLLSPVTAVPVTMAAAAGVALVNSLTHSLGISSGGVLELAVGTAVAAGIGYASGMKLAAGISADLCRDRA